MALKHVENTLYSTEMTYDVKTVVDILFAGNNVDILAGGSNFNQMTPPVFYHSRFPA
jgi:hypothetical protein